jgi:hypothetical protein
MRTPLLLAALLAALTLAHAGEKPEPLIDRPVPVVKLSATLGWRLSGVASLDMVGDAPVLVVGGDVFNVTSQERPSPTLRFGLRGASGSEIYNWTARLDQPRIKPNDWASFEVRLELPPLDARTVEIATINND